MEKVRDCRNELTEAQKALTATERAPHRAARVQRFIRVSLLLLLASLPSRPEILHFLGKDISTIITQPEASLGAKSKTLTAPVFVQTTAF